MNFAELHLLTVLAQTRSYTKAALRLGVSKASVSLRIAQLERSAGVPLVRRTTRSVGLTEAGLQLVSDTAGAFEQIEQSFRTVQDLAAVPRGLVRVTCPVALGRQHISPLVPVFLQRYPEIRLELELTDRLLNLAQEGFDLAIRHADAPPETHVAWTLCETRAVVVASPSYLQCRPFPERPEDLARHQCLIYLREPTQRIWSFEQRAGRKIERVKVPVKGPFRANNSEVLREAVLGGLGIGLLPDFSAAPEIDSGRLIAMLPQWRSLGSFGERVYAIRPPSARVPRAVRCLVDFLRENVREQFHQGAGGFAAP